MAAKYELTPKQRATMKRQGYVYIQRQGRTIKVTPTGSKTMYGRYPTKKKPGDATYSAEWSGVTYAPRARGKKCARCGGPVHREAGSHYCPYCDDYVSVR